MPSSRSTSFFNVFLRLWPSAFEPYHSLPKYSRALPQAAFILFRRHADNLLLTLNPFDVELIGIFGNERADCIVKAAVDHHPIFAFIISWACEEAKSRAIKAWRTECTSCPRPNLAATALRSPPSTKLSPYHRSFNGTRATHSRIIRTLLRPFFRGEYYAHFVQTESVFFPCSDPQQTHAHILTDRPIYDAH